MDAAKTNYTPVQAVPKPPSRAVLAKPSRKGGAKRTLQEHAPAPPAKRAKTGNAEMADQSQDEAAAPEEPADVPAFKQSAFVTGAKLKDFQLEGVAWMAGLYQIGISGILGAYIRDLMRLSRLNLSQRMRWASERLVSMHVWPAFTLTCERCRRCKQLLSMPTFANVPQHRLWSSAQ